MGPRLGLHVPAREPLQAVVPDGCRSRETFFEVAGLDEPPVTIGVASVNSTDVAPRTRSHAGEHVAPRILGVGEHDRRELAELVRRLPLQER